MPCPFATTIFLLYGGIGDAIALTSTAPLERIVLILQTTSSDDKKKKKLSGGGVLDCYYDIVNTQGFKSLWIGNTYRIIHAILTRSFNDYFYKLYTDLLVSSDYDENDSDAHNHKDQELNDEQIQKLHRQRSMAEILSIITPLIILYPFEVVIIHIMSSSSDNITATSSSSSTKTSSKSNNVSDICKSIIQKESGSIASLFKGIGWTILANVQYRYSYYWLYNKFTKISLLQRRNQFWPTQIIWMLCGIAIQPYQVIQRNLVLGKTTNNNPYNDGNLLFVGIIPNSVKIFMNGIVTTIYGNLTRKYIRF